MCADAAARLVLLEVQKAAIASGQIALPGLMAGRKPDGCLQVAAEEKLEEPLNATMLSLKPEVDGFGRQLAWQLSFRKAKRDAKLNPEQRAKQAQGDWSESQTISFLIRHPCMRIVLIRSS